MAAKHLSARKNWQTETGKKATKNEKRTYLMLRESLDSGQYKVTRKPVVLIGKLRLEPELVIENSLNGKKIIIDDKLGNRGGNAHERAYKYCTGKVKAAGYIPLIIFSGKTFASQDPYSYMNKKGKAIKVNPQKYRNEFEELLEPEQYFIATGTNDTDLRNKIEEMLAS